MEGRGRGRVGKEGLSLEGRVLQCNGGGRGDPPKRSWGQTHIWGLSSVCVCVCVDLWETCFYASWCHEHPLNSLDLWKSNPRNDAVQSFSAQMCRSSEKVLSTRSTCKPLVRLGCLKRYVCSHEARYAIRVLRHFRGGGWTLLFEQRLCDKFQLLRQDGPRKKKKKKSCFDTPTHAH